MRPADIMHQSTRQSTITRHPFSHHDRTRSFASMLQAYTVLYVRFIQDCESTRRLEEGAARLPLLLLGAYHVYLVHIHTIAVAGIGTVSESMIKEPTATGTSSSAIAAP